ncbi:MULTISPECIES: DUF6076 domain-containing protein [unclassified Candidatus Paralachnospira]|uniref:DUF6076 domain-containing protein n=1 Tax=unclassified Candidatus Paralachnospira TaxID=3099471 RepID=UPI003F912AEF
MISAFFTADYRDGRVIFGGKSYPAGVFATHLLNQFYIKDTAARIAVFRDDLNYHILTQLSNGYLSITEFVKTGANTLEALKALPKLRPFDGLNIEEIQNTVTTLFTEENGQKICEYFADKAKLSLLTQDDIAAGTADRMKNVTDFSVIESNITEIKSILLFFDSLADDLILAHGSLLKFCRRIDEVERLDEAHLLPLALEIFVDYHFTQSGIYISVKKNAKSVTGIVAKRLNFDSYYSLILTDFFEGLHYGHYPRKCEICGKYFLMQSARRQKYCPYGIAPELYRGKKITCRKYAAVLNRKEKAENDPIVSLYNRRCGAIRTEVGRCTISKAFGEAAKHLAKEHKLRALADDQYAKTQYRKDMSREALYTEVDRILK